MLVSKRIYAGISVTGGRQPFFYVVVDGQGRMLTATGAEADDVLAFLLAQEAVVVAINAPQAPNRGLVRARMAQSMPGRRVRGGNLRLAEETLHARGIQVGKTPGDTALCPDWMQAGFALYQKLGAGGFVFYPQPDAPRIMLETHPHAVFYTLLAQQPLARHTLLGRMQRQLVLVQQGLRLRDPMDFFEEVTRYRLLRADLPFDWIYESEKLDALAAALTAWQTDRHPGAITRVGDPQEGQIVLPVAALPSGDTT